MRAIFIAVGSELLERDRVDTNSLYVARRLREKGILMDMKMVVGDNMEELTWTIKNACRRCQLVIVTGGLGPTEDDLTREAAANALKKELIFKEEIVDEIRTVFKSRGLEMPQINTRQAFVIEGAEVLPNGVGTAPGQYLDEDPCRLLLLPGPPREMIPMFEKVFVEKIAPLSNYHIYTRSFQFAGITESMTDSLIAEIYTKYRSVKTTILAAPGIISVHLLGRSRKSLQEAQAPTDELAEKIKERMKEYLITEGDMTFEEYIVQALIKNNLTLSTAESCTGGGLGNRITDVPGSSEVFLGGVIAYANELKMKLLGVTEKTLLKQGAVSAETALEMARGARRLTGSAIGLGITGIAGPGGGGDNKPVGLVYMHLSSEQMEKGFHRVFPGDRKTIKTRSENFGLNLIREYINQYGSATE
jgi:nicotinamide-nucleotide amidase